ncbi:MAG: DUF2283 domain-containing protein [Candidatus Brocadia sp.]|nr:DUF2283 domain-containing protein [Candidatus Brocadia sp.]
MADFEIYFSRHTKKQMKIEYAKEVDALYIRIQEKEVSHTKELEEGINSDLDDVGKVIGLEIIGATERYNLKDIFNISTKNLILDEPIKS